MSDIEQLQHRISAAMDRVAYGLTQLEPNSAEDVDALKAALSQEQAAKAELQARAIALSQETATQRAQAETAMASLKDKMAALDADMQKLKHANDKLREANQALREANQNGVGNPHLINMSIVAELESLRAARGVERAEAEAILAALTSTLTSNEGATHA